MVCPGGAFLNINAVARAVVVLQFRPFPDAYRLKEVRRTPQILLLAVIADVGQIVAVIQPDPVHAGGIAPVHFTVALINTAVTTT